MASRRVTAREAQAVEKWRPLVDDLKTDRDKINCALVLENQDQYFRGCLLTEDDLKAAQELMESGGTASVAVDPNLTGVARFKKVVIPMVRRTFPELVANELVGVQPMSGPVGLAYAIRFVYQNAAGGATAGDEAGYNTIHRSYSGPYTTQNGERLNSPNMEGGTSGTTREMGLRVSRREITARTRKLMGRYTLEAEQDLANMHGIKLEDEITDLLSYELAQEVDREIMYYLQQLALAGGTYTWTYTTGGGAGADGRWEQEIFRTFYTKCITASNAIAYATRRGAGNFIVASVNVCAMLESLVALNSSPLDANIDTSVQGSAKVGSIGRFALYRDMFSTSDYAVVGYKGPTDDDAGLIYCPYIPVLFARATGEENFAPRLGCMTRYALADHLFGASNYYRYIDVSGLAGALGSFTSSTSGSTAIPYTEDT
jgi:hypothetical protein